MMSTIGDYRGCRTELSPYVDSNGSEGRHRRSDRRPRGRGDPRALASQLSQPLPASLPGNAETGGGAGWGEDEAVASIGDRALAQRAADGVDRRIMIRAHAAADPRSHDLADEGCRRRRTKALLQPDVGGLENRLRREEGRRLQGCSCCWSCEIEAAGGAVKLSSGRSLWDVLVSVPVATYGRRDRMTPEQAVELLPDEILRLRTTGAHARNRRP